VLAAVRHEAWVRDRDQIQGMAALVADLYQRKLTVGLDDRPDGPRPPATRVDAERDECGVARASRMGRRVLVDSDY
jgi:hypothetical protein